MGQCPSNMVTSAINHLPRKEQQGPASSSARELWHSWAHANSPINSQVCALALWSNLLLMMLIKQCCVVMSSGTGECC